jgi:hypothetical protein
MTRRFLPGVAAAVLICLAAGSAPAQMPNPQQMSGVPLPVGDVPAGTVTVRVIRGSFANPVTSQTVELVGGTTPVSAVTNDIGRAEFSGLTPGTRVKAVATVAGERLESQEFTVPATGGIRLILVAPGGAAPVPGASTGLPAPASPAGAESLVFGEDSRFVFEMGEDGLSVFYVLQVKNPGTTPVQPAGPITFELPEDARGAALLQGSSPQAAVNGRTLRIAGPFAPGLTAVQVGYTMPVRGAELAIEQKLPLTLMHVAVVAQKVGDMRLSSPQVAEQRDMPAQGNIYIAGRGGVVQAGDTLRFTFTGMPHETTWPRTVALALALVILLGGGWSALGGDRSSSGKDAQRRQLEARRERLFEELTALEIRHREDTLDSSTYAARRRELIAALERVYAALDERGAVGRAS